MLKKIAFLVLILLFMMPFHAYAWVSVNQTGYWKIISVNQFEKFGWNDGYAEWQQNVTDFNGFWFMMDNEIWENWREWYQFGILSIGESTNDLWIKIKIATLSKTLWVVWHIHGVSSWFGLIQNVKDEVGASDNASNWDDVKLNHVSFSGYDLFNVQQWNPPEGEIFIKNEGDKTLVYWFFDIPNQTNKYLGKVLEFQGTLSGNAAITLIYQHGGYGRIKASCDNSFTLPNFPPYETKGKGGGWWDWFSWLSGLNYGQIATTLWSMILIFGSFVKLSLPLLGFFALFWILDCIISSIVYAEPRIIGDAMIKVYDFVRGVWQTLVNIASALWDFITFWS